MPEGRRQTVLGLLDHCVLSLSLHPVGCMISINDRVILDESELQFDFMRASGPGGQNVNKVSTAVRLRFPVSQSACLPEDVRLRLCRLAGKKMGADGVLTIVARAKRTQEGNRRDAIERLVELIARACQRPKTRRDTRPTLASKKRRLQSKRIHSQTKAQRRSPASPED